MKKPSILKIILISIIAFLVGYTTPVFLIASTSQQNFFATLRNMPQRGIFSSLLKSETLKTYSTYEQVLNNLKENYHKSIDVTKVTYSGISGMLQSFDDPYTYFLEPERYKTMREENEGNFSGIGAVLQTDKLGQVVIREIMKDTPAGKSGLKAGDIIIKVNGESAENQDLNDVVKKIRGAIGTNVILSIIRDGQNPFDVTVTRAKINDITVTAKMADDKNGIGYVRLHQFNQIADDEVNNAINELASQGMKAVILDLRNNPGGLLEQAIDVSSEFIKKGLVVIIQEKGGKRQHIPVNPTVQNHEIFPIIVLVNGYSASASEIVSGAIKDNKAGIIMGSTTYGKGLVQSVVPLFDGSAVSITTAKYLTPNDIDINKKGIEPDYFVKESEDFDPYNPSTDAQLNAAIEVMKVKLGISPDSKLASISKESEKLKNEYHKELEKKKKSEELLKEE